jgi:hypothetical protein
LGLLFVEKGTKEKGTRCENDLSREKQTRKKKLIAARKNILCDKASAALFIKVCNSITCLACAAL